VQETIAPARSKEPTGFAFEWLSPDEKAEVTRADTARATLKLVQYALFYAATLILALAPIPGPAAFALGVNILAALLNGLAIGLLYVIGHDCVHQAYFRTSLMNNIFGRLTFIPCAHSFTQWEVVHNRNHHGKTNYKGVDYVWSPMDVEEYRAASPIRRAVERLYRGALGPMPYYLFEFWAKRLVAPITKEMRADWKRHLPDSLFVIGTLSATIGGVLVLGKALQPERSLIIVALLGWVVPYLTWNYLVGLSTYLHHTHPGVHWFSDPARWSFYRGVIRGTTHSVFPHWVGLLFANAMEHTAHHALTAIPVYKLPAAEKKLLARYKGAVVEQTFGPKGYAAILRACKLYDYRRQCWTDFQGEPTSTSFAETPELGVNPFRRTAPEKARADAAA
jgi:omega-6 fatty acid desaturase (delta-12 desaturase)